jgi:hypothetical protein
MIGDGTGLLPVAGLIFLYLGKEKYSKESLVISGCVFEVRFRPVGRATFFCFAKRK